MSVRAYLHRTICPWKRRTYIHSYGCSCNLKNWRQEFVAVLAGRSEFQHESPSIVSHCDGDSPTHG